MRDRLQPGPKSLLRVVAKGLHRPQQLEQHGLSDVLGVGLLQPPLAAPALDPPPVPLDELGPCRLIGGRLLQPPSNVTLVTEFIGTIRAEAETLTRQRILPLPGASHKTATWMPQPRPSATKGRTTLS